MPPGPTPLPFVGNRFDLPASKPWIKFHEWSQIYGPIFTVWIGRRPTIVISDPNIAVELMEKRSNKYSSRPRFVAMGELYWDLAPLLVQPYGKEWSLRRKLLHQALTPAALRTYKSRQEAEASRLMWHIVEQPNNWEESVDRFTASVVFSISYGHRIDSLDADIIKQRTDFMQYAASLNVPGAYAVESFPFLKHLPNVIAPWKKTIQDKGKDEAQANIALLHQVERDVEAAKESGDADISASLARNLLKMREKEGTTLSQRDFAGIPASLFGAGSDTTASTTCSAILAFVTNPHILATAQAELDEIVGKDRSPVFADEPHLPYIRALVKEVLRWRPVAVLGGTPHASTEDDVYEGFHIPSGTTILGNSWAINLNPEYYPDPHNFNPARFLDITDSRCAQHLKGRDHPAKAGHSSFGWGRRICPGADLAANSLFVALAKLVWSFDIRPSFEGKKYDTFDYTEGFNIRPRPFECQIVVRSEGHIRVLESEKREADREMAKFPPFA